MEFYLILIVLGLVLTSDAAPLSETDVKETVTSFAYFSVKQGIYYQTAHDRLPVTGKSVPCLQVKARQRARASTLARARHPPGESYFVVTGSPSQFDSEFGGYFEGDLVLTAAQRAEIDQAITVADDEDSRNGLVAASQRWPDKTVVYHIKDEFNRRQLEMIHHALFDIENHSCIKFRKRRNAREHAVIISGNQEGCFSSVGFVAKTDEKQVLNLDKGCFVHGTIVHEMLHTIGFFHMQSTYDRDEYVRIVWKNIIQDAATLENFAKYNRATATDFGVPYDYGSVMHYPRDAFSVNGKDTVVPTKANVSIGQRRGLSQSDIVKLNKMYNCPKKEENTSEYNNTAIFS